MKCSKCGKKLKNDDMFCEHCGAKVEKTENTVSQKATSNNKKNEKQKFYKKTWFVILMLIFVFPLGLFLMWKFTSWKKPVKIVVTILIALFLIFGIIGNSNKPQTDTKNTAKTEKTQDKNNSDKSEKQESSNEENKSEIAKISSDKELKKYLEDNYMNKPIKDFYQSFKNEGYNFAFVDYANNDIAEDIVVSSFNVNTFDGPVVLKEILEAKMKDKYIKLKYDAQNPTNN